MPRAALPATQQADTTADCLASRADYVSLRALPLGCAPVGLNLQVRNEGHCNPGHLTVEAMKKAGVEPALIYAYEETGMMVNDENERRIPDVDLAEWDAAIDEYERTTGAKATRRRLNRHDLHGILANGPTG